MTRDGDTKKSTVIAAVTGGDAFIFRGYDTVAEESVSYPLFYLARCLGNNRQQSFTNSINKTKIIKKHAVTTKNHSNIIPIDSNEP